ncbi:hypothetical protein CYMTET_46226 [Cymbomonas tetramitiformis]|uniref:Uncharacterized protein n=1 Tax=Cymbomonas tetramitiformis TaxID=36881 RepID=A0AAE0BWL6_9CHLO|nr:hypothetical protein CYMTET_46226 [Cymbomonas tetramitiformis]|eukprot:gene18516-22104_t
MWNVTADGHPDTRGVCPYACRESFAPDRVPSAAAAASPRPGISHWPTPPTVPPSPAALALRDGQPEPPPDTQAAVMTFRPTAALTIEEIEPADLTSDPPGAAASIAAVQFDEDFDWPAYRTTPRIPSFQGEQASRLSEK